jgi:hypothetical protein
VRNSEDAHRESGEAISFTPSVSIDIHAWEGTTKTFIETNSKLFITSLRGVVSAITDNGRLGGHEAEDKKLIIKVKNFLEELTDE